MSKKSGADDFIFFSFLSGKGGCLSTLLFIVGVLAMLSAVI